MFNVCINKFGTMHLCFGMYSIFIIAFDLLCHVWNGVVHIVEILPICCNGPVLVNMKEVMDMSRGYMAGSVSCPWEFHAENMD